MTVVTLPYLYINASSMASGFSISTGFGGAKRASRDAFRAARSAPLVAIGFETPFITICEGWA